jgi:RNA polymerase-binding transcription factor DksA
MTNDGHAPRQVGDAKINKLPDGRPACEPLPDPNLPPQKVDDGSYERHAAQEPDVKATLEAKQEELQNQHADKKPGLPKRPKYEAVMEFTVCYVGKVWRHVSQGRWFRRYQEPYPDAIPKPPDPLVRADPGGAVHRVSQAEDRNLEEIHLKQVVDGEKSLPPKVKEGLAPGECAGCGNPIPTHHPDGRKVRSDAEFCPSCKDNTKARLDDKNAPRPIDNGPPKRPWEKEGVSRATWLRRNRPKGGTN